MANWAEAYQEALGKHQGAVDQLVAAEVGSVTDEEQRQQYHYMRNNPQDLLRWAERMNGPNRAAQEAQRYLRTMQKRYG